MELVCSFRNAKKGVSFDALLLSLPQSLWLTSSSEGLLLVDGAGSSVGGNTGINPAHWSLVDSEVGDSLGRRGHVEGIGDGLSRSYRGIARIHGLPFNVS